MKEDWSNSHVNTLVVGAGCCLPYDGEGRGQEVIV